MPRYPFSGDQPYPRNQWYIGALASEVAAPAAGAAPLGRTLLNEAVIFYRTASGQVAALAGLCPHRWAPLALGRVIGDAVQCPYHGAAFNASGACARVASQDRPPPALSIRTYPVIERGPLVWVWPGDAERADPALLPDAESLGLGAPGWRVDVEAPMRVAARAQIILENLFDQSHIDFVHPATLAGAPIRSDPSRTEMLDADNRFRVIHHMPPVAADAGVRALFPNVGEQVVARLHVELLGVSLVNSVGSHTVALDAAGRAARLLGRMNFIHGLTPETASSTHYFSAVTRDFALTDDALSQFLASRNVQVMREDIALLEAVETGLYAADPRREATFAADAAAMQVRRRMERLIAAEQSGG
jgi:vanillate O-demethylase monooxygenase subunit